MPKPKNPVTCIKCGSPNGYPKSGLCPSCTNMLRPAECCVIYRWTPEMDDYLRRIYADNAQNTRELSRALRSFAERHRLPRRNLTYRAQRLGLATSRHHKWSAEDIEILREMQGQPVGRIAATLKRGVAPVQAMMDALKISRAVTEGYSRVEVALLLGVSGHTVRQWIASGLLRVSRETDRVTEASLKKFVYGHPEHYSLKRVDEAWFKGMLFPNFGIAPDRSDRKGPCSDLGSEMMAGDYAPESEAAAI